ncbi:hypothetical protein [Fibrella forsythiae]|uniref:Uncharacterized protein n=1 Tax=Fibrella forsythiae TaxID=2817061 RepID=A0ABS3JTE2_9BACT|nr:hypothetical protein [Fibrella forsythiae]MBO0953283.1 hypothetical protein [Fibrella forsythiae]
METNQATFLLLISGNVVEKLKTDSAVLMARWEYPRRLTSVLVKAQLLDSTEPLRAGQAVKKHFSIYGIVRSVHYWPKGAEDVLSVSQ